MNIYVRMFICIFLRVHVFVYNHICTFLHVFFVQSMHVFVHFTTYMFVCVHFFRKFPCVCAHLLQIFFKQHFHLLFLISYVYLLAALQAIPAGTRLTVYRGLQVWLVFSQLRILKMARRAEIHVFFVLGE